MKWFLKYVVVCKTSGKSGVFVNNRKTLTIEARQLRLFYQVEKWHVEHELHSYIFPVVVF